LLPLGRIWAEMDLREDGLCGGKRDGLASPKKISVLKKSVIPNHTETIGICPFTPNPARKATGDAGTGKAIPHASKSAP